MSSGTVPVGLSRVVGRRLTPEPERELPTDPVKWSRETLDVFLWSAQRKIMRSVIENRKTAVQSCHGIGKSFTAALLAAWWIAAHPRGEAMVVTSAPSGDQVRKILWGEIRKAKERGGLPGSITRAATPTWTIGGQEVAFGRKPADYVDENTARTQFQGIHARYLLVLLDEACGIPTWLWDATQSLVTNEGSRILAIGNPDDPTTQFATNCAPGTDYNVIAVSAFDTPNFTDEQVPEDLRELLVGKTYVEEAERSWGVESPLYISKVLGLFPEVADDVIITPKMVREAHELDLTGRMIGAKKRYGMDVARHGGDETCVYENRGGVIRLVDGWRGLDIHVSTNRARAILGPVHAAPPMAIDVVGMGWGIYDPLRHEGYDVQAFSGGEQAMDPTRFVNKNAESWWALREAMQDGLIDLDPEDLDLAAQLQSRKWKPDPAQKRIRVETKDEMKHRGIASPDRGDGAVMSYYEGANVPDPEVVLGARGEPRPDTSITGDLLHMKT